MSVPMPIDLSRPRSEKPVWWGYIFPNEDAERRFLVLHRGVVWALYLLTDTTTKLEDLTAEHLHGDHNSRKEAEDALQSVQALFQVVNVDQVVSAIGRDIVAFNQCSTLFYEVKTVRGLPRVQRSQGIDWAAGLRLEVMNLIEVIMEFLAERVGVKMVDIEPEPVVVRQEVPNHKAALFAANLDREDLYTYRPHNRC